VAQKLRRRLFLRVCRATTRPVFSTRPRARRAPFRLRSEVRREALISSNPWSASSTVYACSMIRSPSSLRLRSVRRKHLDAGCPSLPELQPRAALSGARPPRNCFGAIRIHSRGGVSRAAAQQPTHWSNSKYSRYRSTPPPLPHCNSPRAPSIQL